MNQTAHREHYFHLGFSEIQCKELHFLIYHYEIDIVNYADDNTTLCAKENHDFVFGELKSSFLCFTNGCKIVTRGPIQTGKVFRSYP